MLLAGGRARPGSEAFSLVSTQSAGAPGLAVLIQWFSAQVQPYLGTLVSVEAMRLGVSSPQHRQFVYQPVLVVRFDSLPSQLA